MLVAKLMYESPISTFEPAVSSPILRVLFETRALSFLHEPRRNPDVLNPASCHDLFLPGSRVLFRRGSLAGLA